MCEKITENLNTIFLNLGTKGIVGDIGVKGELGDRGFPGEKGKKKKRANLSKSLYIHKHISISLTRMDPGLPP